MNVLTSPDVPVESRLPAPPSGPLDSLLLESLDAGVVGLDAAGVCTFANSSAVRILGYDREELTGRKLHALVHHTRSDGSPYLESDCPALRTLADHTARRDGSDLLWRRDGTSVAVSFSVSPLLDGERCVGAVVSFEDRSANARTEEVLRASEERLAGIIGSAMDAIITVDSQQRIVVFNHAAEQMFRISAKRAIGQDINQLLPERFRAAHRDHIGAFGSTGVTSRTMQSLQPLVARRSDGEEFPIEATISQVEAAGQKLYTVILRDITERRAAEEALAQNQADIEALNERLQRAMTETHHRVKNNLQIIAAMIDLRLMESAAVIEPDELRRLGEYVRTLAAVHEVLTQEAKEDGEARYVSTRDVLGRLLALMQETAPDRTIRSQVEDVRLVARHGTSLALVVNELVSNAVKHGRNEVEVVLRQIRDSIALLVSDDGPGFPAGFDPGVSANTGLELVENLARWDLGGHTSYRNREEGGACVSVSFPLGQADDAALQPF